MYPIKAYNDPHLFGGKIIFQSFFIFQIIGIGRKTVVHVSINFPFFHLIGFVHKVALNSQKDQEQRGKKNNEIFTFQHHNDKYKNLAFPK